MRDDGLHVRRGPFGQPLDQRDEGASRRREGVVDPGRDDRKDRAGDEPVGLQGAERRRQHARRYVGDRAAQFAEAHGFVLAQDQDHEQRPFVAETGDDVAYGADLDDRIFFALLLHDDGFRVRDGGRPHDKDKQSVRQMQSRRLGFVPLREKSKKVRFLRGPQPAGSLQKRAEGYYAMFS